MVCLSVGSTMLVHRLQKHQRDSLAKHIDIGACLCDSNCTWGVAGPMFCVLLANLN